MSSHSTLSIPLLALQLSCTGKSDSGADGESDETDESGGPACPSGVGPVEGEACATAQRLEGIEEFVAPESAPPTCSSGWASDAEFREAAWAVLIPSGGQYDIEYQPPVTKALPTGGAILIEGTTIHWFDGQGAELAAVAHGFWEADGIGSLIYEIEPDAISVRADGHVFVAHGTEADEVVIREFADGTVIGEVAVSTPVELPYVDGMFALSDEEWLVVGDGSAYENAFLIRADSVGNTVFEDSWRLFDEDEGYYEAITFAAFDGAYLLIGTTADEQEVRDPTDATVIASLSFGDFLRDSAGSKVGTGFALLDDAGQFNFDAVVMGVDGAGLELWSRTYDRAMTPDGFHTIAGRPEGGFVIGGQDGVWWEGPRPLGPDAQPLVIAIDEAGNAEWLARLAMQGATESVDAGAAGVFAAGRTSRGCDPEILNWVWIGRW